MIKTLVTLSEGQIKKIKTAYEKKRSVRIFLSYKKIEKSGNFELLLTESQKESFNKNRAIGKGIILELSYEQLKKKSFRWIPTPTLRRPCSSWSSCRW